MPSQKFSRLTLDGLASMKTTIAKLLPHSKHSDPVSFISSTLFLKALIKQDYLMSGVILLSESYNCSLLLINIYLSFATNYKFGLTKVLYGEWLKN